MIHLDHGTQSQLLQNFSLATGPCLQPIILTSSLEKWVTSSPPLLSPSLLNVCSLMAQMGYGVGEEPSLQRTFLWTEVGTSVRDLSEHWLEFPGQ